MATYRLCIKCVKHKLNSTAILHHQLCQKLTNWLPQKPQGDKYLVALTPFGKSVLAPNPFGILQFQR